MTLFLTLFNYFKRGIQIKRDCVPIVWNILYFYLLGFVFNCIMLHNTLLKHILKNQIVDFDKLSYYHQIDTRKVTELWCFVYCQGILGPFP